MAYDINRGIIQLDALTTSGIALTAGDKVFWSPPLPIIIRQFVMIVTVATTGGDPATVALEKRITAGSDTGRVTAGVPTVIIPGGSPQARGVYKSSLNFLVNPGEEIVGRVVDATAAGSAHWLVMYELSPQVPGVFTNMVASA